ncbi:MAG: TonB C-terminal domain-containing protein [Sulfurovaceae bacterium]|nr:TonB C-terminal domain-containing protein [Sulfurovaceae bacterium]
MEKEYTFKSGIIAVGIYIVIVGLLFWHFGYKSEEKDIGTQTEQIIAVDLSTLDTSKDLLPSKPVQTESNDILQSINEPQEEKPQIKKPIEQPQKEIVAKQQEPIEKKQELIEKKQIPADKPKETSPVIKKQETKKIEKTKPIQKFKNQPANTTDLFANIKSDKPIHPTPKTKTSSKQSMPAAAKLPQSSSSAASELINKEFSKKGDAGVEDAYKSKVRSILQGWPAQSSYAGERAKISFVIQPNGDFDFKITQPSANEEFNQGLVQYLKQLQKVGFGPHAGSRAYLFDVNFIAER